MDSNGKSMLIISTFIDINKANRYIYDRACMWSADALEFVKRPLSFGNYNPQKHRGLPFFMRFLFSLA